MGACSSATDDSTRLLFLDVDGVLCKIHNDHEHNSEHSTLSPDCLEAVARLIRLSQCKIVVSSAWRLGTATRKALTTQLVSVGVPEEDILGFTPLLGHGTKQRCSEVMLWILTHTQCRLYVDLPIGISRQLPEWDEETGLEMGMFLVIDDQELTFDDSKYGSLIENNFIGTSPTTGLTQSTADLCVQHFKRPFDAKAWVLENKEKLQTMLHQFRRKPVELQPEDMLFDLEQMALEQSI